LNVRGKTTGR